ncbi:enhancer of split m5 protein-like [Musca vetustissima]|uniref:enhancer of split m5 protein-like n=1 Tax=Musca vetustissima TaxID=27455 RepID=UPI002AB6B9FD|nr:enhancer of split m5 protein-like [Musca vetustissima]
MAPQTEFVSKTQHYLKVKKPLLERQRRARMNKCLDALKELVAEFQGNDAILRMDKAEMLESALEFMKTQVKPQEQQQTTSLQLPAMVPMDSFRNGYMNAVNEVSRVMAGTPGINVNIGKAVMTHLGSEFNRLLQQTTVPVVRDEVAEANKVNIKAPMSPASSGYCSDNEEQQSSQGSPNSTISSSSSSMWRPW